MQGLVLETENLPGADFRVLLDAFNDRWVAANRFLSTDVLLELLRLSGEWTSAYYEAVDPRAPCEPVGFFGSTGEPSPFWQAIAREYMERWIHHSQVRRALSLSSLADEPFVSVGAAVAASSAGVEAILNDGVWTIGPVSLGAPQQTADILTRAHAPDEIRRLAGGPPDLVDLLAIIAGRP
ncbi:MAG TPA: maleylpyruvate isomerase N-terminal domain-containing protein [Acidimicrobiales bacterium]|nr:maleylpyruvate isomerase N-terminal domain-containing protein [Acidimicrobiales bacterium]